MTALPPRQERTAGRVLLVDAQERVLLLHSQDPLDPSAGSWWLSPGGGLEPGETRAGGAARELAEETGLRLEPAALGDVVHEDVGEFCFAGRRLRQRNAYFLARVSAPLVDLSGCTPLERRAVLGYRWWTVADLQATRERFYPEQLPELLDRLLRAG